MFREIGRRLLCILLTLASGQDVLYFCFRSRLVFATVIYEMKGCFIQVQHKRQGTVDVRWLSPIQLCDLVDGELDDLVCDNLPHLQQVDLGSQRLRPVLELLDLLPPGNRDPCFQNDSISGNLRLLITANRNLDSLVPGRGGKTLRDAETSAQPGDYHLSNLHTALDFLCKSGSQHSITGDPRRRRKPVARSAPKRSMAILNSIKCMSKRLRELGANHDPVR